MVLAAAIPQPSKARPRRVRRESGPAMRETLATAGINVQQCVHNRTTGNYILNIFEPGLQKPVAPAQVWTDKMLKSFEGIKIVDVGETRAHWRKGCPVVMVDITFTGDQITPKPKTQPAKVDVTTAPFRTRWYAEVCEPAKI